VPGDTPFLPEDLVARLGAAPAWAATAGAVHPLVAVWPVDMRGALAAWLADGRSLRVRDFGGAIGMRTVEFADAGDPFLNINTPDDLARARSFGPGRLEI
jgi:molybdopterin-guanine dinucleotide biosynthesis protein A